MTQTYPTPPQQPWGADEQTARIPQQFHPAGYPQRGPVGYPQPHPVGYPQHGPAGPPPPAAPFAGPPKKRRRWPWIVGGLVALLVVGSAIGGRGAPPAPTAAAPAPSAPAAAAPPVVEQVPAPAVEVPVVVEPELTVSQQNALDSAESYLAFTGFSRTGLIEQLEFEGYPTADATFAVDTVTVDWMVQAERKAQSYLDFTSFSRSGLIDQLEFEGFTAEQAAHGADSVGL